MEALDNVHLDSISVEGRKSVEPPRFLTQAGVDLDVVNSHVSFVASHHLGLKDDLKQKKKKKKKITSVRLTSAQCIAEKADRIADD